MKKLAQGAAALKEGAIVVTMTDPVPSPAFEVLEEVRTESLMTIPATALSPALEMMPEERNTEQYLRPFGVRVRVSVVIPASSPAFEVLGEINKDYFRRRACCSGYSSTQKRQPLRKPLSSTGISGSCRLSRVFFVFCDRGVPCCYCPVSVGLGGT